MTDLIAFLHADHTITKADDPQISINGGELRPCGYKMKPEQHVETVVPYPGMLYARKGWQRPQTYEIKVPFLIDISTTNDLTFRLIDGAHERTGRGFVTEMCMTSDSGDTTTIEARFDPLPQQPSGEPK